MKHKKDIYSMKPGARIYLASPLSGKTNAEITANMEKAVVKLLACEAVYKKCKFIAPHTWFPRFLDDNNPEERAFALECGQRILSFCDAILLCGPRISSGMEAELRAAVREGKSCFAEDQLYKDAAEIETDEKLRMEENVNSKYSKAVLVAAKKVCDSFDCPPCGCYTCKPVTEPLSDGASMSVCPLAKFQNSIATMEPVNENITFEFEELAALCRACNHTGKYGKRTNQSFYAHCINCPVESIRDCMMECAAEAAYS